MKVFGFLYIIGCLLCFSGCSNENKNSIVPVSDSIEVTQNTSSITTNDQSVTSYTFPENIYIAETYSSILENPSKIEIQEGSSGEKIIITDSGQLEAITSLLKNISLEKDPDQTDRTGWQYRLKCYSETSTIKWFELVIGTSTLTDESLSENQQEKSPYYILNNEEELVKWIKEKQ